MDPYNVDDTLPKSFKVARVHIHYIDSIVTELQKVYRIKDDHPTFPRLVTTVAQLYYSYNPDTSLVVQKFFTTDNEFKQFIYFYEDPDDSDNECCLSEDCADCEDSAEEAI